MTDDSIRSAMHQLALSFRDNAPVTAAQAATIILDGVRHDTWRILVGDDAQAIDRLVRESPETAYEPSFMQGVAPAGVSQMDRVTDPGAGGMTTYFTTGRFGSCNQFS